MVRNGLSRRRISHCTSSYGLLNGTLGYSGVLWGVLKREMLLFFLLASCAAGASSDPDSDPALETCVACSCASVENILYVNCEDLTTHLPSQLRPPASSLYHLSFQNNLLVVLHPGSFFNFTHAVSLHLGNNKMQSIEGGAFLGLGALKQLHLNNNELKALRSDTFLGSESLEYIQADYNLIRLIERGTFSKLHKLKVLILNDNLVQSLPENVFRFASLTHLDIRGNRIQTLPYIGVLEHIGRVVELQLDDNPWKCTCDLLPLKAWLENMPYDIFIGEAICETPIDLYGRLLKETHKAELCPAGTDSDFDVQMPPPQPGNGHAATNADPAATPHLITKEPQPTASSKISGIVSGKAFPGTQNLSQLVPSQTGVPSVSPCPLPCTCKAHPSDFGISLSCQERNIENLSDLEPMPPNARKLHLSGNCIKIIAPNDFHAFQGLDFLHLGSNQIVTVQKGVFSNLTNLRRLYLNGNQLERLHPQMFLGLTNLQYLYLEYNAIKEVLAGTFDPMPNLQLLYLNNNVLRSLPAYIFSGLSVARLNLKNNHFRYLPVSGVLDQLRYLTQIDLEGNPWDCTCDLVALKLWLEKLNDGVAAEEVRCASPVQFSNIELRLLKNEILCPKLIAKPPLVLSEPTPLATSTSPVDGDQGLPGESIPFSIIILSILVVLILTVSVAFCFLLFVLKCRKKPASRHAELGNQECGSLQLEHQCCRRDSLDQDTFSPQTIQNICSSHTCGLRDFHLTCSDSLFLSNSADTLDPRKAALGGIEEIDEFLPGNMFFQNFLKSKDYSNMGMSDFDVQYPEKSQNKTKKRSLIPGRLSKASEDQRRREYFELKAKLQGSPDYLQVLEEQSVLSRM